jgi:Tfp pilus assembly protein FimV
MTMAHFTELVHYGEAASAPMPLWESEQEEWAFRVEYMRAIRPNGLSDAPELAAYLEQRIAAEPSNLFKHVQRIALEHQLNRPEPLYAALLDLFIVLGSGGYALRRRMTESTRNRLLPNQYARLVHCLQSGLALDAEAVPSLRATLFGLGMGEAVPLVGMEEIVDADADARDPLIEARECIEYSQIDQARQILERAVAAQPQRADLQWELLELYRAQRDAGHFRKLYPAFTTDANPLAEDWRATARFLNADEPR